MICLDARLYKMARPTLQPLAVEVDQEESARMIKAAAYGMAYLPRINRKTFIRFLCVNCGLDFGVRADTAILGRHKCPSIVCEGKKA